MVVGRGLFEYKKYEEHGLDEEAGHLWQMMCFTGEDFEPEQLQMSALAGEYFDSACALSLFLFPCKVNSGRSCFRVCLGYQVGSNHIRRDSGTLLRCR